MAGTIPVWATPATAAVAPVRVEAVQPAAVDCAAQPDETRAMSAARACGPVEMKYDKAGRQTSIVATNDSTGAKLTSFSYTYTKDGKDTGLRQSVTDLTGTTTYAYDKLNRLTGASGALTRSYGYDENFNRTSKTENGTNTSYTYNDAHQLTAAGSTTYSYDANGNTTGSSSGWAFDYNANNNQTTSITAPGGTPLSALTYGGADQTERRSAGLVSYSTSALGVSSATSPIGITKPVTPESVHPPAGTTDYYTRDSSGGLLGLRNGSKRYYYLLDGLGSVVGLVDDRATKWNSYSYDPYGIQLSASQRIANPWRYASGYFDGGTGLTKFGARYYDPALGRFTQTDPSGKDLPYAYAGCDPANNTDPTGLLTGGDWAAGLVGAVTSGFVAAGVTALCVGGGVATAGFALGMCALAGGVAAAAIGGVVGGTTALLTGGSVESAVMGGVFGLGTAVASFFNPQ